MMLFVGVMLTLSAVVTGLLVYKILTDKEDEPKKVKKRAYIKRLGK